MDIDDQVKVSDEVVDDVPKSSISLKNFIEKEGFMQSEYDLNKEFNIKELPESLTEIPENYMKIPYELYLQKLQEENIIKEFEVDIELERLTNDTILELSEQSMSIELDDKTSNVYIKDVEGKRIINITEEVAFTDKRTIAETLPDVRIDVVQAGIKEKAIEAESIYKMVVINNLYSHKFNKEIGLLLDSYNFERMESERGTFKQLLEKIQINSTPVLRLIISACNIKLIEFKTKKEAKLYMSLSDLENQELLDLKVKILAWTTQRQAKFDASASPGEQLIYREKTEEEVEVIKRKSKVATIYKILNLTIEDMKDPERMDIYLYAERLAHDIKLHERLEGRMSLVNDIERKLRRRGVREYLTEVKSRLLKEYREKGSVDFSSL